MNESYDWVLWDALKNHFGHRVVIACYGNARCPSDVCLECEDCGEVIVDAGLYTLCVREEEPLL